MVCARTVAGSTGHCQVACRVDWSLVLVLCTAILFNSGDRGSPAPARGVVEPAPKRADEIDRKRELARLEVGVEALLREQRLLRREHLEVVADALAVAQQREIVGFLRGRERLRLLSTLLGDAAKRSEIVDNVAQRVGE